MSETNPPSHWSCSSEASSRSRVALPKLVELRRHLGSCPPRWFHKECEGSLYFRVRRNPGRRQGQKPNSDAVGLGSRSQASKRSAGRLRKSKRPRARLKRERGFSGCVSAPRLAVEESAPRHRVRRQRAGPPAVGIARSRDDKRRGIFSMAQLRLERIPFNNHCVPSHLRPLGPFDRNSTSASVDRHKGVPGGAWWSGFPSEGKLGSRGPMASVYQRRVGPGWQQSVRPAMFPFLRNGYSLSAMSESQNAGLVNSPWCGGANSRGNALPGRRLHEKASRGERIVVDHDTGEIGVQRAGRNRVPS